MNDKATPADVYDVRAELITRLTVREDCSDEELTFLALPNAVASDGEDLNAFVSNEPFDWADREWTVAIFDTPWYAADAADIREYAAALARAAAHADILNASAGLAIRSAILPAKGEGNDLVSVTFPDGYVKYRWGGGIDLEGHAEGDTWPKTFRPSDGADGPYPGWTVTQHYFGEFVKVGTDERDGVEYALLASTIKATDGKAIQKSKSARVAPPADSDSNPQLEEESNGMKLNPNNPAHATMLAAIAAKYGASLEHKGAVELSDPDAAWWEFTLTAPAVGEGMPYIDIAWDDESQWVIDPCVGDPLRFTAAEFSTTLKMCAVGIALTNELNGQASA